jgi:hypothetical protein
MKFISLLVAAALLSACNSPKRFEANRSAAESWLSSQVGAARGNVTGKWTDASRDGWGDADLVQKGSRISGTLGNYEVNGVANGSRVFLALKSDGWFYYSAEAEDSGSVLKGQYVKGVPDRSYHKLAGGSPFEFRRVR